VNEEDSSSGLVQTMYKYFCFASIPEFLLDKQSLLVLR
jgi:hypothetical protein